MKLGALWELLLVTTVFFHHAFANPSDLKITEVDSLLEEYTEISQTPENLILSVQVSCDGVFVNIDLPSGTSPGNICNFQLLQDGVPKNIRCNGVCPIDCSPRLIIDLNPGSFYKLTVTTGQGLSAENNFKAENFRNDYLSINEVTETTATVRTISSQASIRSNCKYTVTDASTISKVSFSCEGGNCNSCDSVKITGLEPFTEYVIRSSYTNQLFCNDAIDFFKTAPLTATGSFEARPNSIAYEFSYSAPVTTIRCTIYLYKANSQVGQYHFFDQDCIRHQLNYLRPNTLYTIELTSNYFSNSIQYSVRTISANITQSVDAQTSIGEVKIRVQTDITNSRFAVCIKTFNSTSVYCIDCDEKCADFTVRFTDNTPFISTIRSPTTATPSTLLVVPKTPQSALMSFLPSFGAMELAFTYTPVIDGDECRIRLKTIDGTKIGVLCSQLECPTDCNRLVFILLYLEPQTNYIISIESKFNKQPQEFNVYTTSIDYRLFYGDFDYDFFEMVLRSNDTNSIYREYCHFTTTALFDPLKEFINDCTTISFGRLVPASLYTLTLRSNTFTGRKVYSAITKMTPPRFLNLTQLTANSLLIQWTSELIITELFVDFNLTIYEGTVKEASPNNRIARGFFNLVEDFVIVFGFDPNKTYTVILCTSIYAFRLCDLNDGLCDNCISREIFMEIPPDVRPRAGTIYYDDDGLLKITMPGVFMQNGLSSCHLIIGYLRKRRSTPSYYVDPVKFNKTSYMTVINGDLWRVQATAPVSYCAINKSFIVGIGGETGNITNDPLLSDFDLTAVQVVCNETICFSSEAYEPFVIERKNIPFYVLMSIGFFVYFVLLIWSVISLLSRLQDNGGILNLEKPGDNYLDQNFKNTNIRESLGDAINNGQREAYHSVNQNIFNPTTTGISQGFLINRKHIDEVNFKLHEENSSLFTYWWNKVSNLNVSHMLSTVKRIPKKTDNLRAIKESQKSISRVFPGAYFITGLENNREYILSDAPKPSTLMSYASLFKEYDIQTVVVFHDDEVLNDNDDFVMMMRGEKKFELPSDIQLEHELTEYSHNVEMNTYRITSSKSSHQIRFFHYFGSVNERIDEISTKLVGLRKLITDWKNDPWIPTVISGINGLDSAATFLAIDYNIKRIESSLENFNVVAIFSLIRSSIPSCLNDPENFLLVHYVLNSLQDVSGKGVNLPVLKNYISASLKEIENPLLIDYLNYQVTNNEIIQELKVVVPKANKSNSVTLNEPIQGFDELDVSCITPSDSKCCYIDCKNPTRNNFDAFLTLVYHLKPMVIVHLGKRLDYSYYLNKSYIGDIDVEATFDAPVKVHQSIQQVTMHLEKDKTKFSTIILYYNKIESDLNSSASKELTSILNYVATQIKFSSDEAPRVMVHSPLPHLHSAPFIGALIYMKYIGDNMDNICYLNVMRALRQARPMMIPNFSCFQLMLSLLNKAL